VSRAFVREPDAETPPEPLADITLPPPPNPVTPRGLALIEAAVADLEERLARAPPELKPDPAEAAELRRRLRYWTARRAIAQLTAPPSDPEEVGFGSHVTLAWPGRGEVRIEIVGEDESDPPAGRVSWRAPTAAALIGNGVGDTIDAPIGGETRRLKILAVDNNG
jgi:transcription elongation GreA/GreB family factor